MYTIRDPTKDKPFEIEIGWLCEESHWKFSLVPSALVTEADESSRASVIAVGGTTTATAQETKQDVEEVKMET